MWPRDQETQVGNLNYFTTEELQGLLERQENILSNRGLLRTLPDKGRKVQEFAEKLRVAIDLRNEEERRQGLESVSRIEFRSKNEQIVTFQNAVSATGEDSYKSCENVDVADKVDIDPSVELVEAMNRVTVSSNDNNTQFNRKAEENYFLQNHSPKKPHYVSVIEKGGLLSANQRQKFKPNQAIQKVDVSSSTSSEPLSPQARREQERKYMDAITAAKLPPLYHSPAQLLSLEESATLLKEQTTKQQELLAKNAAQKLAERQTISMTNFYPYSCPGLTYREVHDEGVQLSDED